MVSERGFPSFAELVGAASPRSREGRGRGEGATPGGDRKRPGRRPPGLAGPRERPPLSPVQGAEIKWPQGGGSVPAGGKAERLTEAGRPGSPESPSELGSPILGPGPPCLSPRNPEILADAPAGGPHLPLRTEAAPAPPSHIGRGRAARSQPRPPDRAAAGPRAPPPAATLPLPFICGSRCHKMALREEARPRRPTPFPSPPDAPPYAASPNAPQPPSAPFPSQVRVRPTHRRIASRSRPQQSARHRAPPRGRKAKGRRPIGASSR